MDNNKNIKWGIVFSYITMAAGMVISLTYTPFLLRQLGQQQYGLYNMGQAVVSYLGLTEFGLGNAIVRYASVYLGKGDTKKTASLYGMFIYIYNFLSTIILVGGIFVACLAHRFFSVSTGAEGYKELRIIILVMVFNLAFSFSTVVYSAIITTYERFSFLKITNLLYTILKPVVMIPLLLYGYKAIALSVVTFVLTVFLNLANVIYVKKVLKITIDMDRKKMEFGVLKEVLGYSFFIFLGSITAQLNDNADNVILGIISGEMAVAIYAVGYQLNSYIQQIPGIISSVFFPKVTMRITKGASLEEMSDLMIRVGRIQYYIVFLLCSGFCLFGQEFIYLWAGEGYGDAYWIVLALILPATIPNIQTMAVLIIQALNKHQFKAITYVICALFNVALSIPAGIKYGPIGCAICTGVATIITKGLIINWYYHKKIQLNIKKFWITIVTLFVKSLPLVVLGLILNILMEASNSWMMLFVKILLYVGMFGIYMLTVCMSSEEKRLLTNFMTRRKEM